MDKVVNVGDIKYYPRTKVVVSSSTSKVKLNRLQALIFEYFIEYPNEVISKERLRTEIWKNLHVAEDTVKWQVNDTRNVLSKVSQDTYIETVRGSGYKFVATIEYPSIKTKNKFILTLPWLLLASTLVFAIVFVINSNIYIERPKILTTKKGNEADGSVFNNVLIYSHKGFSNENWNLYAKHIESGRDHQITKGDFADRKATFSPNGKKIAYHRYVDKQCQVRVADFNESKLNLENNTLVYDCPNEQQSIGLSWASDNELLISFSSVSTEPIKVHLLNILTKNINTLTDPKNTVEGDYYAIYSSMSNYLVHFRFSTGNTTEIWARTGLFGKSKKVTEIPLVLLSGAFINNDENIVVKTSFNRFGIIELSSGDIIKEFPEQNIPRFSPFTISNSSFGFTNYPNNHADIIMRDKGGKYENFIESAFHDYSPVIGNKEDEVYFISTRTGHAQIFKKDSQDYVKQLTHYNDGYYLRFLTINSQGTHLAYVRNNQIILRSINGAVITQTEDSAMYRNLEFSPDGKQLFYSIKYDDTWKIEQRNIDDFYSPTILTEGYLLKFSDDHKSPPLVRKYNENIFYELVGLELKGEGVYLPNIHSIQQLEITQNELFYVNGHSQAPKLYKMDRSTSLREEVLDLPVPYFVFSKTSEKLLTYKLYKNDTHLAQVVF